MFSYAIFNFIVLDDMMHEEFECFWLDVVEYAEELGVSTSYIEEEFLIEGELIQIPMDNTKPINFRKNNNDNGEYRFDPRPGPM